MMLELVALVAGASLATFHLRLAYRITRASTTVRCPTTTTIFMVNVQSEN